MLSFVAHPGGHQGQKAQAYPLECDIASIEVIKFAFVYERERESG